MGIDMVLGIDRITPVRAIDNGSARALDGRLLYNHRLIIAHNQDPEVPLGKKIQATDSKSHDTNGESITLARIVFLAALPLLAYAAVFIFETDTSRSAEAAEYVSEENSQTIALLEAIPNPRAGVDALGGGDITIVGGTALLSESGPSGTLADIEGTASDRISLYVVREGDTLSQIAGMFGVSANTIRWANDINANGTIQPGETLVILPISGVQHTVKSGDTLKSIAEKYDGDLNEILQYNGLTADASLSVGDTLTIPNGEVAAPAPTYAPIPAPSGASYAGNYQRPIDGGYRSQGLHGYNGVDLATYYGAPILAAASGEVIISRAGGWNGGYGNYIVIAHDNGTQTLYAHNSQNIVSSGQRVVQGQVIGYVGSTGYSTGAHLHFEVRGAPNPF